MKQLNLNDIYSDNNLLKVYKYSEENKERIKVPSNHKNFTHDVYENTGNKTLTEKWIYTYAGSTGWVNHKDDNS